jgi:hypothetical protein|nr:MAG TPA: hypothetical protein [Caudoviricetes sp.]
MRIRFMDLAVCLNVHTFIIWEFIRRHGLEKGVKKDRWGRGSVPPRECRKWIDKLATYISGHDFTYKQEVNKRQYLFRDEARRNEEMRNEQDAPRRYTIDKEGRISRATLFSDGSMMIWHWSADGWQFDRWEGDKVTK